jgi:predicted ArsR family transcriptional regulator
MTTARQKVLTYLKKNRAVSAAQIGRALNLSAATVRHHLSVLVSDERIEELGVTQRDGRGRPVKLFGLSEKLMGNNLSVLAGVLLDEFVGRWSPSKREAALRSVAKRMAEKIGLVDGNVPIAKRLALVVEKFNDMNYQARWEAGSGGPRILFGLCPYAAMIKKHPELCQMDADMLEVGLGQTVSLVKKTDTNFKGMCPFVFELGIISQNTSFKS